MAYHRSHDLDVRIVRIFNTYGPRMRPEDGRVVSNFITQALRGEPITVYGDGKQTRSFCYVDDQIGATSPSSTATSADRSTSATTSSSPCSSWPSR
jgi:nucleoside-diphosphate-sugar epimerase